MVPQQMAWKAKYTDDQRAAIIRAGLDLRIRPFTDITRMAAAGELRAEVNGPLIPPFEIPDSTVRDLCRSRERRRAGQTVKGDLANEAPRTQAEMLRKRLVALIDIELERLEKARKPLDAEQIRKLARALRELALLPGPDEVRIPRAPAERQADGSLADDHATRDSLAGQILRASDRHAGRTAQTEPTTQGQGSTETRPTSREQATNRHDHHDNEQNGTDDGLGGQTGLVEHGLVADGVSVAAS